MTEKKFGGSIGAIHVPGAFGRHADSVYAELLLAKHAYDNRRTAPPLDKPSHKRGSASDNAGQQQAE